MPHRHHDAPRIMPTTAATAAMSCATAVMNRATCVAFMVFSFGPARDARDEEEPDGHEAGAEQAAWQPLMSGRRCTSPYRRGSERLVALADPSKLRIPTSTRRGARDIGLSVTFSIAPDQLLIRRTEPDANDGPRQHHRWRNLTVCALQGCHHRDCAQARTEQCAFPAATIRHSFLQFQLNVSQREPVQPFHRPFSTASCRTGPSPARPLHTIADDCERLGCRTGVTAYMRENDRPSADRPGGLTEDHRSS